MIEKWCDDNQKNCIIFSTDGDFLGYRHHRLTIRSDYDVYLSETLKEIDAIRTQLLDEVYNDQRLTLLYEIKQWVEGEVDLFDSFSAFVNDNEIHDTSDIKVEVLKDSYEIIQLSNDNDEVQIEVTVTVNIKASVLTDDPDYAYYDSDDKSYHYFETITVEIDTTEEISFIYSIHLVSEEDNDGEFTLIEPNGGKPLELYPEIDY